MREKATKGEKHGKGKVTERAWQKEHKMSESMTNGEKQWLIAWQKEKGNE